MIKLIWNTDYNYYSLFRRESKPKQYQILYESQHCLTQIVKPTRGKFNRSYASISPQPHSSIAWNAFHGDLGMEVGSTAHIDSKIHSRKNISQLGHNSRARGEATHATAQTLEIVPFARSPSKAVSHRNHAHSQCIATRKTTLSTAKRRRREKFGHNHE